MKPSAFAAALLLASCAASASDGFASRHASALALERSAAGREYLMRFMTEVDAPSTALVEKCFEYGKKGTTDRFSLVADVLEDGSIANIAVRPETSQTRCFAEGMARVRAPRPPAGFAKRGFPIAIDTSNEYK